MTRATLGLDIGGANLKAFHTAGVARHVPFRLWEKPGELPAALAALQADLPAAEVLAVTMTGELCDCFASKRAGVGAILDAVERTRGDRPVRVWRNDGRFVTPEEARATALQVAAANWLALATVAGRFAPAGPALLIDVGSTTTDVIPLHRGKPVPKGRTDPERLQSLELVYTGVRRTPLCAVLGSHVAAELFATTLDAYLVLGAIAEEPGNRDTADGRPATRAAAHARLARMLGADLETSTPDQRQKLANLLLLKQVYLVRTAMEIVAGKLPAPPQTIVLAGEGEFLARVAVKESEALKSSRLVSLAERLAPPISQTACAYAVAVLASERGT
jgi:(4-(4-[2-(gamma-L-glutamylamino)ethyl]phenoxymethyl)furan-2-yl)methanamine synthase